MQKNHQITNTMLNAGNQLHKKKIKQLENIQIYALKRLLKLPYTTAPTTTLAIAKVQSIQH